MTATQPDPDGPLVDGPGRWVLPCIMAYNALDQIALLDMGQWSFYDGENRARLLLLVVAGCAASYRRMWIRAETHCRRSDAAADSPSSPQRNAP